MTKNKVDAKGTVGLDKAIGYLEDILEGMKNGRIVVRQGDRIVTFQPVNDVEMEIEAKEKDGRQKFSMEMTWSEHARARELSGLSISSEESMPEELIPEESVLSA